MPVMRYKAEDGTEILVDVEAPQSDDGYEMVAASGGGPLEAQASFEQAIGGIKPIADRIVSTISSLAQKPKETEVSFGVTFGGEAGVILAKTSLEASLTVTLKW